MPSKLRRTCAAKYDLVWEKLDEPIDDWLAAVRTSDVYRSVAHFILKFKPGNAVEMHRAFKGDYNVVYRLEYSDGTSVIMRIPINDGVPATFQDEKVRYEVAVMRYVAANTSIPVPHVYHYGTAVENPLGLGPFIIMDYIDHYETLSGVLRDPDRPVEKHPVLNPNIDERHLALLYKQVADVLLQLDVLRFPRIGSLVEDAATGTIDVKGRPLLANMIDVVIHTAFPPVRRDAVEDANDARDKYVARQLFRRGGRASVFTRGHGFRRRPARHFALLRGPAPGQHSFLYKDDRIVGVIDWEFAYAAPLSFSSCPPWWLPMDKPESWSPGGLMGWQQTCEPRLRTFLSALEEVEKHEQQPVSAGEPLSQRMSSWTSNASMRNYAARRSWAFDFLWWKHIDESLYGPNEDQDHKARLAEMPAAQLQILDDFVKQKLDEGEDAEVTVWDKDAAVAHLAQYL
ncbi:uncharacterized protein SPSK_02455 [Sporothrix schenckii 1099-18]|uniref:Uncharacterized protein n=1 Tax=Sporothrix schenckii 1099-18 TaxID=1397361 RepID=A0A0F2MDQ2_SPOSC|nr:uncharacterized protein SPSK_02455 [Sporothrix schenckii 1099-18]KJR86276.1 hypothetical protein SPSK_02455 [Sporothrix schenckii 1099-18]